MRRKEEISRAVSRSEAIRSRSSLGRARRDIRRCCGGEARLEEEVEVEVEVGGEA